jgi:multidrug efflux pump subunit AcrA (membrane-fusion protein)
MKRNIFLISLGVVIIIVFFLASKFNQDPAEDLEIYAQAKKGTFKIEITSAGELDAKNSVNIEGPFGLRRARIWEVKIEDLVDEGTVVKKGDYVASLDASELSDRIENEENDLLQSTSEFTQARLDTALELRKERDNLINLKYEIDQKRIALEQSQYEPPATIKQAEYDLEKATRTYEQAIENYELLKEKAVAQVTEARAEMMDDQRRLNFLNDIREQMEIYAPEDGMVIYNRNWRGEKQGIGSTVRAWDPTVATLPDLSKMISRTYINEVDINFVSENQEVQIGLDAFPDKELTGTVVEVANIGEQRPNTDAKVFQVLIEIHESDTTLRPGMTTSNKILAEEIPNVVFIPIECIHSQGDSITYVYKKEGLGYVKQEVATGKSNSDQTIIMAGVESGDELYLSDPEGSEKKELNLLSASN